MLSPRSRTEFAISLRQDAPLHNNFIQPEEQRHRHLDDFFLYTSVGGLRFLHSKNPLWFQLISIIALVTSMFMSVYHSWTFVHKFLQPRHTAQLTAAYYSEVDSPAIIICPYKRFKMIHPNHTSDFAHIIANLWQDPASEPVIKNLTLGHFLNETFNKLEEIIGQKKFDNKTLKECDLWRQKVDKILPEAYTLINFEMFKPDLMFQWTSLRQYRFWKLQNESCYMEKYHISKKQFYTCRLKKIHQLLVQTIQNYKNFTVKLKQPPPIDGFIIRCNWWSGSLCKYEYIDSPFGIKCIKVSGQEQLKIPISLIHLPTKIIVDTQVFNNQADNWQRNELRVTLVDENSLTPDTSDYYITGGGMFLDLEINSFTDVYYKGSCRGTLDKTSYAFASVAGPREEACRYRNFEIDHSVTNYEIDQTSIDLYMTKLREKREKTWAEIDAFNDERIFPNYEPEIFNQVHPLFDSYFDGLFMLGQIFPGCCVPEFIGNKTSFVISKNCSESKLIADTYVKISRIVKDIYEYEKNTTNPNSTIGFAHSVRDYNHLHVTKFIRYYGNSTNIEVLGKFFNEIYKIMTAFRNNLSAGSVCSELILYVQNFLTNNTMVQRTPFNSRKTVLEWRLSEILERKDARLIHSYYESQNFISIRVRFRHLYGVVISQADEYNMFRLIADIGSAMGLYFGLSVLTIYEFCVFVFVKDAAEGVVPPPSRNNIYHTEQQKSDKELNVPPPSS